MKLIILALSLLVSEAAFACKCASDYSQTLWDTPHKAKTAMLIKFTSPETGVPLKTAQANVSSLKFEKRGWTKSSLTKWESGHTTCDLRPQDNVWYVLVTDVSEGVMPMLCNSVFSPAAEVPEVVADLGRHWDSSQLLPNPTWSVGCQKAADCAVSSGGCVGSLPILTKFENQATAWRKTTEARMNCEARPASKVKVKAFCQTGVCELRTQAGI